MNRSSTYDPSVEPRVSAVPNSVWGSQVTSTLRASLALVRHHCASCLPPISVLLVTFGMAFGAMISAQTAHFSWSQNSIGSGPFGSAWVAVDSSGNVYITDSNTNSVLKETPSAGGYIESTVASPSSGGLVSPQSIAVDTAGSVDINDSGNDRVVKETPSAGGYTQNTVVASTTGSLSGLVGLAVDESGNVYLALGNPDGEVQFPMAWPTFHYVLFGRQVIRPRNSS